MAKPKKMQVADSRSIWEREEPAARAATVALSRDAIVAAAIAIADAQDLASVSLRNVASSLGAGPMRLYGYMATKEELLELMVDAIYEEALPSKTRTGDWRRALRAIAHATRQAAAQHPWVVDLLGGRPHQGPNALAYMERLLSTLSTAPGFQDIDATMMAAKAVNAYMIGAIRSEHAELRAEQASGKSKTVWQTEGGPYMQRMIATGKFPTLSKVLRDATHPPFDTVFEQGLECVLDGITARLAVKL